MSRQNDDQSKNIDDGLCRYGRSHGAVYRAGCCLVCYRKRRTPADPRYSCAECGQIGQNKRSCIITFIKEAMS